MSENELELKAVMDAVNRRIEVVVPEGFAVMVNGIRMAPALGTEQNPAASPDDLPNGTGLVVLEDGSKTWYMNGNRHREDGPAVEYANGTKLWIQNCKKHRVDGPAVIYVGSDGTVGKFWYQNNVLHRVDGPAVERANGTKEYWLHGEYMTEAEFLGATLKIGKNDPEGTAKVTDSTVTPDEFPVGSEQNPAKDQAGLPDGTGIVVDFSGLKFWYLNWQLHREDGPAVEWPSGTKFWYQDGELHREDGPAIEYANGTKFWYLNGEELSETEFLERSQ